MKLIYKVESNKTIHKAIKDLKNSLNNHQFGVLWEFNFNEKFKEKGLKFNSNYYVFEVCNPEQAKSVLEKNLEVGFFLPCKLVVYEDNSKVYIGMIKPTEFISNFDDTELTEIALQIENVLIDTINLAK